MRSGCSFSLTINHNVNSYNSNIYKHAQKKKKQNITSYHSSTCIILERRHTHCTVLFINKGVLVNWEAKLANVDSSKLLQGKNKPPTSVSGFEWGMCWLLVSLCNYKELLEGIRYPPVCQYMNTGNPLNIFLFEVWYCLGWEVFSGSI